MRIFNPLFINKLGTLILQDYIESLLHLGLHHIYDYILCKLRQELTHVQINIMTNWLRIIEKLIQHIYGRKTIQNTQDV